ncbi:ABC transporter ATP-binding protein [Methanothermobacter wolfeii]|uniref:ABC transporter ATP-binding protein n=1 Tax=Methanothermobacter wolfeii TaxID=145261 RepID=A0ABU8TSI4_METWO|nr:ABC transporter ATP-binding protein [Methanothermobacter sp. THM-1]NLM03108.1 ABC transporter ATP-binding protein [Methanothermobacter wolfeii]QHN07056.1 ABC transporter ATP-binding protein [Methanothermobacter sp. THM-1]SCM58631.1 putative ABC transporter ATP-binding protein YfiL [Methanothermobacter wolfeii]
MIEVESLSKSFGRVKALDNLSFDVGDGELLGIIGHNGAGKTTVIRIIAGILHPDSGRVFVGGYDVTEDPVRVKSMIGYLPEEPNLYERFRARDLLRYFGELYGVRGDVLEERIWELLDLVGMSERAYDPINTFSKGMRQRIGIARALIHDPPVIILDEPTMGLDPATAYSIREFVRKLKGSKTILLCTHYMEEAEYLCDRVAIINQGRILDIGTPSELKSKIKGNTVLEVVLADPSAADISMIEGIDGVKSVELDGNTLRVSLECGDVTGRVLHGIGDNIRSVNTRETTLNDVFIERVRSP